MVTSVDTADDLRAWAKGMYTTEAAVELLLRGFNGRFAESECPWIQLNDAGGWWLELEAIPDNVGGLSSGERAFLLIAASIGLGGSDGDQVAVNLSDTLPSLGRQQLDLVLAAAAHAGGSHQHSDVGVGPAGAASFIRLPSLHPWPEQR